MDGILLVIVVAYLGIAAQFWLRRRTAIGGRATSALGQLVIIFVFCAFCGYLPRIVPIPELPLLLAHIILAVAAWGYFLARQVDRLSLAVDNADQDDPDARLRRRAAVDELVNDEIEAVARLLDNSGQSVAAGLVRRRLHARNAAPADGSEGAAIAAG